MIDTAKLAQDIHNLIQSTPRSVGPDDIRKVIDQEVELAKKRLAGCGYVVPEFSYEAQPTAMEFAARFPWLLPLVKREGQDKWVPLLPEDQQHQWTPDKGIQNAKLKSVPISNSDVDMFTTMKIVYGSAANVGTAEGGHRCALCDFRCVMSG